MSRRTCLQLAMLLSIALWGKALAGDEGEKWGRVTAQQMDLAAPDSFPEAAAIVIFDLGKLEVPAPYRDALIKFNRHVRIKIVNMAGADQAATPTITLYGGDKFNNFKAQTILRNGSKLELSDKDVFRKDVGSDKQLLTFTFPGLEDGCILEYRYQVVHRRFSYLDPWLFQGPLYTLKSQFTLILHAGLEYSALASNVPEECRKPEREAITIEKDSPVQFRWTLRNLCPIEPEPYMAAAITYRASLTCQLSSYRDPYNNLSFVKDWQTLGDEVLRQYDAFTEKKGTVGSVAASLTANEPITDDKLRRLYQYVRDEILTSNDQGYFPFGEGSVAEVLARKVGNAREKNALLIEMLRSLSINANPLLIATRDYAAFNPNVYHMAQFNHLICLIDTDNRTYILDTGDRGVPFDYLPPDDLSNGGLLLKPSSSTTISLTIPQRRSQLDTYSKIRLHMDGSAVCSTHVTIKGYLISSLQELFESQPKEEQLRSLLFRGRIPEFSIDSYQPNGPVDGDSATLDLVTTFPIYANRSGQQFICPSSPCFDCTNPFEKTKRLFPVDFNYTMSINDVVDLECDKGITVASAPPDTNMMIDGISLTRSVFSGGGSARLMSQLIVGKTVFSPAAYDRIRGLFVKRSELSTQPVTLTF